MSGGPIEVEGGTLTRVAYVDVSIPPEAAGLSGADLDRIPWRAPVWAQGDQVRAGAAAWFADLSGRRLVFDPVQAADDVLRANPAVERAQQSRLAEVFEAAGFPRHSVDLVVLSHIEGVGMVGWRDDAGTWSPFFPNARILVSEVALRSSLESPPAAGRELELGAWSALIEQGVVGSYADAEVIVPGLRAEVTGGHCPGHAVLHFGEHAASARVSMVGHLAISPLHLAVGELPELHQDGATAWKLLRAVAEDGRVLIGPLWPAPGCGRWIDGVFEPGA